MPFTHEQIQRLRHRHRGYILTLATEVLLILALPVCQSHTWLLSLLLISLSVVLVTTVTRYSPLVSTRPLLYGLGGLALALEGVWHLALAFDPPLGRIVTVPHVIAWLLFFLVALMRKVKTLVREPFVTLAVVMGATSGYLLVGIAGGVMLVALWVLHPGAFDLSALPVLQDRNDNAVAMAPALMAASFMILTTVGSAVLRSGDVTGQVITVVITIAGQLYIAILIALILGRFHSRPGGGRALAPPRSSREGRQPSIR
ncbi:hypothetical protein [Synechococcus sp. BA-132 BA5]|uniref:hypothetical protein n=1 Tax=Synechococcus sp. BA-132 BA5 TaxID=3110252 RepID=UPI002B1FE389|nr:hypothetical protein [Synechococcus sp. BA-132 BA5]MEA5414533.1 hypothetical protein [Synechococcus sp. BA-132 BA5]